MNVIPFPNKKSEPPVKVELPNKTTLNITIEKLKKAFDDPHLLTDRERSGLVQLAIAILYTDHCECIRTMMN